MFPTTSGRVRAHTADRVNARIRERTEDDVLYYAEHPDRIEERLAELDEEWDIERTLEANAASFSLAGLGLALSLDRRFLALPIAVAGFLLHHAVRGWCPPISAFRRMGVRTAREIDEERTALKALRGDFDILPRMAADPVIRARYALRAARGR